MQPTTLSCHKMCKLSLLLWPNGQRLHFESQNVIWEKSVYITHLLKRQTKGEAETNKSKANLSACEMDGEYLSRVISRTETLRNVST